MGKNQHSKDRLYVTQWENKHEWSGASHDQQYLLFISIFS